MEYRQALEIALLGAKGAGKSKFRQSYDKYAKQLEIPYDIMIEKYKSFEIPNEINEKDGALILFDLTNEDSLPAVLNMISSITIPKVLVGCNSDSSERKISNVEAKIQADQNGCMYIEFPDSEVLVVINMIIGEIEDSRDNKKNKKCVIRLSFQNMQRLQKIAMLLALVAGFFGLSVLALGATLVISTENTSYR